MTQNDTTREPVTGPAANGWNPVRIVGVILFGLAVISWAYILTEASGPLRHLDAWVVPVYAWALDLRHAAILAATLATVMFTVGRRRRLIAPSVVGAVMLTTDLTFESTDFTGPAALLVAVVLAAVPVAEPLWAVGRDPTMETTRQQAFAAAIAVPGLAAAVILAEQIQWHRPQDIAGPAQTVYLPELTALIAACLATVGLVSILTFAGRLPDIGHVAGALVVFAVVSIAAAGLWDEYLDKGTTLLMAAPLAVLSTGLLGMSWSSGRLLRLRDWALITVGVSVVLPALTSMLTPVAEGLVGLAGVATIADRVLLTIPAMMVLLPLTWLFTVTLDRQLTAGPIGSRPTGSRRKPAAGTVQSTR